MRKTPTIEQCRQGGRKRAQAFTSEYQSEMGKRRAGQLSFIEHNQRIAPDGFSAVSAYMRGPSGLRLLDPTHIQFLQPQQLRGPKGKRLSYEQQRVYFGLCLWQAIWQDIAPQVQDTPTDESFLLNVARVGERLQCGLSLENPLDIIYASPADFCDQTGEPWSVRKQRHLFRQALATGREAAKVLARQAIEEYVTGEWRLGQRRPQPRTPIFGHKSAGTSKFVYGRSDLPSYHPYNLLPQRPYGVAVTNDSHPIIHLAAVSQVEQDEF